MALLLSVVLAKLVVIHTKCHTKVILELSLVNLLAM